MKNKLRLMPLILAATMCVALCSCGGGTTTVTKENSAAMDSNDDWETASVEKNGEGNSNAEEQADSNQAITTLTLGEKYSVADYADISLVSIESTKDITSAMDGVGLHYENSEANQTYIDVIFEITNTNTSAINSDDLMVATAKSESGAEYRCSLYLVETHDMTSLSSWEDISPLSTARFHAAFSVPEAEKKFALSFNVNGSQFEYSFEANTTVKKTVDLHVGDVIENNDYATLEFVSADFAESVLPSNTSGYYNFYETDNADNIYLALEFKITNYQANSKDIDTFVSAKATFMGKYKYTGFVVSEDSDQQGLSSYNQISPLQTAKVIYLIEVPKTVMDKDFSVDIFFDKQSYTYTG